LLLFCLLFEAISRDLNFAFLFLLLQFFFRGVVGVLYFDFFPILWQQFEEKGLLYGGGF